MTDFSLEWIEAKWNDQYDKPDPDTAAVVRLVTWEQENFKMFLGTSRADIEANMKEHFGRMEAVEIAVNKGKFTGREFWFSDGVDVSTMENISVEIGLIEDMLNGKSKGFR